MKISYNWLKEYVPLKMTPEKLAELLTFHVAEVESVEKVGKDSVLSLDVLPNRAHDLNSHIGVAREVATLTSYKLQVISYKLGEDKRKKTGEVLSVRVEDPAGCPRYIGRYVEGVKIGPSPKWMKDRLETVGMRSINNVVDATNYVMLEFGQPLHAFDADQIASTEVKSEKLKVESAGKNAKKEIVVRKARKGEKFTTLDNQTFVLNGEELLIADSEKALALAGIKGGKKAGITAKTKNIILEAANFDPTLVHRTSRKLGLVTDASKRFGGGLHPSLAERAMTRLASLIQQLAGGTVYGGTVDVYPRKWPVARVAFDQAACNAILGVSLKEAEMKRMLAALGCKVQSAKLKVKSQKWLVEVPPERLDLKMPEDLYEEIGRLYGWENIPSRAPHAVLVPGGEAAVYRMASFARRTLAGMGWSEHVGYSFMGEEMATVFRKAGYMPAEIANPLNAETQYLRPTLLPSLLAAVSGNTKRRDIIRLFEIGKTFHRKTGEDREQWNLGLVLCMKKEAKKHEAWYTLKGAVDALLEGVGIMDITFADMPQEKREALGVLYEPQTLGYVLAGEEPLGGMGTVNARVKNVYGLEGTVVFAHIDIPGLIQETEREREFAEIPKYPSVLRDLAVLVPKNTKVEQVQNVLEREGGELLFDVDLFDVYEGKEVSEDEESLAFHLVFQSSERTLKDAEVKAVMEKITEALKAESWEVRE